MMRKNWLIAILIITMLLGLYLIELRKIEYNGNDIPNLDDLKVDEVAKSWEPFYRVRATIINGQSAGFSIPKELKNKEGKQIRLCGAAMFYGNGCEVVGEQVSISWFFLVPSLGIAQSCEIRPDISMRWTVRVDLKESWLLDRLDMINSEVAVEGLFKIDLSKPYESAFYIEDANVTLKQEN